MPSRRLPAVQRRPRRRLASAPTASPASTNTGAVFLPGPIIKQDLALDCESAALQVALALQKIDVPQDRIYSSLPQDSRSPELGSDG